jgi:hypothetical protein
MSLVVDDELTRRMAPEWGKRDASKAHTKRLVSLSAGTLRRAMRAVAAEMGRRGGAKTTARLTPEQRRELGLRGSQARWQRAATLRVTPLADPASPLQMWLDDLPDGAPE